MEYTTALEAAGVTAAIIITMDNITINLNSGIIFCNSAVTAVAHGIQIAAGLTNITIKNGTIVGFTGEGISIEGSSSSKITNVKLENITLVSNRNGIIATYVQNATLSNINVSDSNGTDNTHGIHFSNSDSVTIKDTSSIRNHTTTSGKYANGIRLTSCKVNSLINCICSNNQGHSDATGIYIIDSPANNYSNEIINCTSNNNVSSNGNAHGIHLKTCDLVHVQNCIAKSNIASLAGKSAYGIRLESGTNVTCEGNTAIRNNFGFWDDEALGTQTNLFIQNTAYLNVDKSSNIRDYYKTVSTPINHTQSSADQLNNFTSASYKSNISVVIA